MPFARVLQYLNRFPYIDLALPAALVEPANIASSRPRFAFLKGL
jgi:hypothetical protein